MIMKLKKQRPGHKGAVEPVGKKMVITNFTVAQLEAGTRI
jgi:hypothetical protein